MIWRWDQGRLAYFQAGNARLIAKVLNRFDGEPIGAVTDDILREPLLRAAAPLNFPPNDPRYKVWRNFGRVFGQQLLATQIDGTLRVSDVCRSLADNQTPITDEQYIQFWVKRYAVPSPSFEGYDKDDPPVFPFCALIKFALARLSQGEESVSAQDAIGYLIGNGSTGKEDLYYYRSLQRSTLVLSDAQVRQVREMIAVLGQIPFLKWESSVLKLDTSALTPHFERDIMAYATPELRTPRLRKEFEVLNQGSLQNIALPTMELPEPTEGDSVFLEGHRRRVTHIRIERSAKLRQLYLQKTSRPTLCNMCSMDTLATYPWSRLLIEMHHLLPLGSLLRVDLKSTSIADVVGVCPSCHRATHQFYGKWLDARDLEDFDTEEQARNVYQEAKERVVRTA